MPFSRRKPRIGPVWPFASTSFAQKASAIGEFEIHIFAR